MLPQSCPYHRSLPTRVRPPTKLDPVPSEVHSWGQIEDLGFQESGHWRWWSIAQGAARPSLVALSSSPFDQHLGFLQGLKYHSVQQLVSELPGKTLHIPVLSGTARLNVERLNSQGFEPVSNGLSRKAPAVLSLISWTDRTHHTQATGSRASR